MWRKTLEELQSAKDLPVEQQLLASLRISYGALNDVQQRIFLDAAFFFIGRRADTAIRAWKG